VTTTVDSKVLRLEGSVLLDALEAAPTMRSELVGGGRRPGMPAPSSPVVDDPRWEAT
jgi:hypothetical protein